MLSVRNYLNCKTKSRTIIEKYLECRRIWYFFQMPPRDTIASAQIPGRKKRKERIICLTCCDVDRTEKMLPFSVGKSENPRCFNGKASSELDISYSSSPRAWINFSLFLHGQKSLIFIYQILSDEVVHYFLTMHLPMDN